MSPHSYFNRPPVVYRTTTPWWLRLVRRAAPWLLLTAIVSGAVLGTATLIAKLHATEAQLDRAHMAGMAMGMATCEGPRP